MKTIDKISKEQWDAYVGVQESGHYNMFDPRARALANELNDCVLTKEDWKVIISNYEALQDKYKPSKELSTESNTQAPQVVLNEDYTTMVVTNDDCFDFDYEDCLVVDPCYFFTENGKNKVGYDLWAKFCKAMFDEGKKLYLDYCIENDRKAWDDLTKEKCGTPIKGKRGLYKDGKLSHNQELSYSDLPSAYRFDNTGICEFTYAKGKKTIKFLYSGTADGDGCFEVKNKGESFGVDAGMYCIVRLDDLKDFMYAKDYNELLSLGVVVTSVGDVDFDGKGNCEGDIEVCTDGSDTTTCYECSEEYEIGEGSWADDNYCSDECEERQYMKECSECGNEFKEDEGADEDDDYCDSSCYDEANETDEDE